MGLISKLLNGVPALVGKLPLGKKWKTTTGLLLAGLAALVVSLGYGTDQRELIDAFIGAGLALAGVGVLHKDGREEGE